MSSNTTGVTSLRTGISSCHNIAICKYRNDVTAVSTRPVFVLKDQQNNEWCDVTLYGKNSTTGIKGHKMILSSASAQLREVFASKGFTDSDAKEYRSTEIDHATLEVIVNFIYSNTLRVMGGSDTIDRLKSVLIGADCLLMANLRDICEASLMDPAFLTINCAVTMWMFSRKYRCQVLEDAAVQKIAADIAVVAAQVDYLNLDEKSVAALLETLSQTKPCPLSLLVSGITPSQLCEAAVNWLGYKQAERKLHCDEIMRHVRLSGVTIEVLQRTSALSFLSKHVLWAVNEALAMRQVEVALRVELNNTASSRVTEKNLSEKRRVHLEKMIKQAELMDTQVSFYRGGICMPPPEPLSDKAGRFAARSEAGMYAKDDNNGNGRQS